MATLFKDWLMTENARVRHYATGLCVLIRPMAMRRRGSPVQIFEVNCMFTKAHGVQQE